MKTSKTSDKKKCGQCKQMLPPTAFGKGKSRCKHCRSANGFADRCEGVRYGKAKLTGDSRVKAKQA